MVFPDKEFPFGMTSGTLIFACKICFFSTTKTAYFLTSFDPVQIMLKQYTNKKKLFFAILFVLPTN